MCKTAAKVCEGMAKNKKKTVKRYFMRQSFDVLDKQCHIRS